MTPVRAAGECRLAHAAVADSGTGARGVGGRGYHRRMQPNHAFVMMLIGLATGACGGGGTSDDGTDAQDVVAIDATPTIDAVPPVPDAATGPRLNELTDADWTDLCQEIVTPEVTLGQAVAFNSDCTTADCTASPTAVEDCIGALNPTPNACEPPPPDDALRQCAAPVDDLRACYGVVISQFEPYAAATCATVDALAPINFDFATIPECGPLLEQCPDVFGN